jgi:Mn-dependent DtxR family transcriptional regulator
MTTKKQEEDYLRMLYEMTEANDPGRGDIFAVGKKLGYDGPVVEVVTKRLEEQGYVGGRGVGGTIYITPKGKTKVRGVDIDEAMWAYLKRLNEWTESKDPRCGNTISIGETLGLDPDTITTVTNELHRRGYVRLSMNHGIRITSEGIVEARSIM